MPLVEVIRGLRTDDATLELTLQLCRAMKKDRRGRLVLFVVFFAARRQTCVFMIEQPDPVCFRFEQSLIEVCRPPWKDGNRVWQTT